MRVLIACEYSGVTRDAFIRRGHDAYSCDILPSESPGPHLLGDCREFLGGIFGRPWDLMVAHPPCTYLSYVGNRSWNLPGREEKRREAMDFFMTMVNAPIEKICVENPRGLPMVEYRRPDQEIHPYYFGEGERKRTCLWLKNLPPLHFMLADGLWDKRTATDPPKPKYFLKTTGAPVHWCEAVKGGHKRSKSWQSIANAMAEQWG